MQGILEQLRQVFRPHVGWYGVLAAVGLTALGVAAIDTVDPGSAARQARFWLPVAFLAMAAAMLPHPRWIGEVTYPAALAILLLLVFVILPFAPRALVPVRNGATCWIDLGPVSLQPAELAKIAFVLALARYFRYRDSYRTLRGLLVPFVIMFIPVGLLLKQPDLGTALLFAPTLMAMLVAAGAKLRHLSALVAIGIVAIGVNVAIVYYDAPDWMHVLKPHQEARIAAMIWPEKHRQDDAYQQRLAVTLVATGGTEGLGADYAGTVLKYNYLPEAHNDMIFAVISARWGLAGAAAVLGMYLVLGSSFVLAAARSKDPFARLACVGFGAILFVQAAINIGVTLGLMPLTGITLPFISYGGSSLLSSFIMLGLMLNFASRRPAPLTRPSFEFDQPGAVAS